MSTIKETRKAIEEQENPVVTFKYYRIDGENQFSALTERLVEFLNPLTDKGDYLLIPDLDQLMPVKPLRDWLKGCPAELVRVKLVKEYEYIVAPRSNDRFYDTVNYAGLLVEYECDGLKTRAFFAAHGFIQDYNPGKNSLLLRLEFSYGLHETTWSAPAKSKRPASKRHAKYPTCPMLAKDWLSAIGANC
jgi:hypothetical protein